MQICVDSIYKMLKKIDIVFGVMYRTVEKKYRVKNNLQIRLCLVDQFSADIAYMKTTQYLIISNWFDVFLPLPQQCPLVNKQHLEHHWNCNDLVWLRIVTKWTWTSTCYSRSVLHHTIIVEQGSLCLKLKNKVLYLFSCSKSQGEKTKRRLLAATML